MPQFHRHTMTQATIRRLQRFASVVGVFALIASLLPTPSANAAAVTSLKDTLSSGQSNTVANHVLQFVTPTGVGQTTDTITVDFTDFTIGSVDFTDIDFEVDGDAACDGSWTGKTLAATAAAGTWGAAIASSVLTLTPPTDAGGTEIVAGRCVRLLIGLNASGGNAQFTNPNDQSTHVIEIAGSFGDSGSFALDFVSDESVAVSATVDPSITFSISDTAIGFAALSTSAVRYANGAETGSGTVVAAHTMSVGTNATGGLALTYNGALLTAGSNNIDAATISADADGAPGTEQFAISFDDNGSALTMVSAYDEASNNSSFVASTTTQILSTSAPVAATTVDSHYLANIAANTPAGAYTTAITYILTGTF